MFSVFSSMIYIPEFSRSCHLPKTISPKFYNFEKTPICIAKLCVEKLGSSNYWPIVRRKICFLKGIQACTEGIFLFCVSLWTKSCEKSIFINKKVGKANFRDCKQLDILLDIRIPNELTAEFTRKAGALPNGNLHFSTGESSLFRMGELKNTQGPI